MNSIQAVMTKRDFMEHVGYWLTLLTLKCIKIFQSVTQEKW